MKVRSHWLTGAVGLCCSFAMPSTAQTLSPSEARALEISWILEHQNPTGSWGEDEREEITTTATVLRGLRSAGVTNPQIRRGDV